MVKRVAIDSLHVFFLDVVQDLLNLTSAIVLFSFSIYSKVNYSYIAVIYVSPFLICTAQTV